MSDSISKTLHERRPGHVNRGWLMKEHHCRKNMSSNEVAFAESYSTPEDEYPTP